MQPNDSDTRRIEHRVGDWLRARMPHGLSELAVFLVKQAWACLFGVLFLLAIIGSKLIWQADWPLQRYDALFLFAVLTQVTFLFFKLETWEEARVIVLFHLTGSAMEWFKVSQGSWAYPEPGLMKAFGVPLFTGFMYASVGSYIARVIRLFDMRFVPYPPQWVTFVLAAAIYANFIALHFLHDIRLILFAATLVVFLRTRIWFRVSVREYWMPMPLAALLAAIALWVAENVGQATGTWAYSGQGPEHWVSLSKVGSWYLLLYVSFVTVLLAHRRVLVPST
jgi:uncharacterized membrane protein YoaT (DUF817 family)